MDELTPIEREIAERDAAIARIGAANAALVEVAKDTARRIADSHGTVTSTQVLAALREEGYGAVLDAVDRRFMGAVFWPGSGWERVGWSTTGSHGRPVAVWKWSGSR